MPTKRDVTPEDCGTSPSGGVQPLSAPLGPWASYAFAGRTVFATTTPHQRIEVVDLPALGPLGRAYRLDGRFMASLADAHICHELMVHPLLLAHGAVQRVLILGGGDGGSAREALRHPGVREVVVAELDAQVPATILQYLPAMADGAFDDPRTTLVIGDARDLVDAALCRKERFDAVVFDLTEADGNAAALHEAPFFARIRQLLGPGGGVALQLGSPWFQRDQVRRVLGALRGVFRHVRPATAYVPLYGTQWALAYASDAFDVRTALHAAPHTAPSAPGPVARESHHLRYLRHYAPHRHAALFDIAPELANILGEARTGNAPETTR
ncbi:hypothetical protein [Pandoraea sp. CB10b_02]|uniref:spermine/spermidine synthase domain-containing protein n=1 Tax=Pandoraea sp. CB10b_02 TaxID=2014535 RepID=UPI002579ABF6|nr:hypothetical protein [Pandoraea sp. CB10b_02]